MKMIFGFVRKDSFGEVFWALTEIRGSNNMIAIKYFILTQMWVVFHFESGRREKLFEPHRNSRNIGSHSLCVFYCSLYAYVVHFFKSDRFQRDTIKYQSFQFIYLGSCQ